MVILHVEATGCGGKVQLMAGNVEATARGSESTVKFVIGIIHAVFCENRFQTAFIKRSVVSDKWKALNQWLDLRPYICNRKNEM